MEKGNTEVKGAIDNLKPNLIERGATDITAAVFFGWVSVVLTAPMGWLKWPVRGAAVVGGAGLAELFSFLKNRADRRRFAELLMAYEEASSDEAVNRAGEAVDDFIRDHATKIVSDIEDRVNVVKNDLQGRQVEVSELNKILSSAEKVAELVTNIDATVNKAKEEAEGIVSKASSKAEGIVSKASSKAEKLIDSANLRSEKIILSAQEKAGKLLEEMKVLREELAASEPVVEKPKTKRAKAKRS